MPNWDAIKQEYITTDIGRRTLAAKYDVSFNTLKDRAKREQWTEAKREYVQRMGAKAVKATPHESPHLTPVHPTPPKPVVIMEPDAECVRRTAKVFEVSEKLLSVAEEMVDVCRRPSDLKYISGALKDIKEIQMLKTALDDLEQQARIDKLRADAKQQEKDESKTVRMIIEGDEDE